jgi:hypothetical protein
LHTAKLLNFGALRADRLLLSLKGLPLSGNFFVLRLEGVSDKSACCGARYGSYRYATAGVTSLVAHYRAESCAYRATSD